MRPSNLEILAYEDTVLGPLCLRRRELLSQPGTIVTEVTLNHEFLMSSYNTDSERAISNRCVEIHGDNNLTALVGGFGLGYTARELLQHIKVKSVDVVEFLPHVIQWFEDGLIPLSEELRTATQLNVSVGDVYQRLWNDPEIQYDLIVIDVDHSPIDQLGEGDHQFYTTEGLIRAKKHLTESGVLAIWSYVENSSFSSALRETFDQVHVEPVTTVNTLVQHEQTDWLFFGVK